MLSKPREFVSEYLAMHAWSPFGMKANTPTDDVAK